MSFFSKLIDLHKGKPPFCSAVIAAAGTSQRMDGQDKLFFDICGVPVLVHSLAAFQNNNMINEIVVVARDTELNRISEYCARYGIDKVTRIMTGGITRLESVMNGVLGVSKKAEIIAIHDGARPCVDDGVITAAISAALKYHAVAPALPISSTIKRAKDGIVIETVDRKDLYEIQTPQVFKTGIIKAALTKALDKSMEITDDCMAVELIGVPVYITSGSRNNIKLTTCEDIVIAEAILGNCKV